MNKSIIVFQHLSNEYEHYVRKTGRLPDIEKQKSADWHRKENQSVHEQWNIVLLERMCTKKMCKEMCYQ